MLRRGHVQAPARKLVLVDDLPHAHGPEQRARLAELLGQLAATARNPVVVTPSASSWQAVRAALTASVPALMSPS